MKKTVAAVTAGILLIASQAAAAGATTGSQVADRVGARADASEQLVGMDVPTWVIVIGSFVLAGVTIAAMDDDSKSN